nr:unnamed protein product [Digitaria exilis]
MDRGWSSRCRCRRAAGAPRSPCCRSPSFPPPLPEPDLPCSSSGEPKPRGSPTPSPDLPSATSGELVHPFTAAKIHADFASVERWGSGWRDEEEELEVQA